VYRPSVRCLYAFTTVYRLSEHVQHAAQKILRYRYRQRFTRVQDTHSPAKPKCRPERDRTHLAVTKVLLYFGYNRQPIRIHNELALK
jgi:hypothetical protein